MSIRLIVTDMDGTLLDPNDRISEENLRVLLACQQQGIRVILANGRSYLRLLPYLQQLQLERYDGMLIESNGVALYAPKTKQRTVFEQLTLGESKTLCHLFRPYGTEIQIYFDNGVYYYIPEALMRRKEQERKKRHLPEDYPWMGGPWSWVNDTRNGYPNQKRILSFEEIDQERINKINLTSDAETIASLEEEFHRVLPSAYTMVRTCPRMFEIAPRAISKGAALRHYMDQEAIRSDEVIVFGDGENDVSMFNQVSYGIAMGNASEAVKRHAYAVTDTNAADGVAAYLRKIITFRE